MSTMWGIHNSRLTTELVEDGFVSIDWVELGDLGNLPTDRDGMKAALTEIYPDEKPKAVAIWAGILIRFRDEMQPGDVVVAPYRPDSTINLGIVTGDYYYEAGAPGHRHRRPVTWKKLGLSRTAFTKPALYEIGASLTVFRVKAHADEFLAALGATSDSVEEVTRLVEAAAKAEPLDTETLEEPRASRIERHTRDFVLGRLYKDLDEREFEEFTGDLLRAMGYQARVTAFSQDGGIDVIAHRDPLGVEPPLIKGQCKHQVANVGAPEVQRLIGALGAGELALFVTLGGYTTEADRIGRSKPGLRLLTGEDVVTLTLEHYGALPQRWRSRIPLTPLLVVDDSADA